MSSVFSNKNLQSIHVDAEKAISSHLAKLDEISNDIKVLETILAKAGLSITFRFRIDSVSKNKIRSNEFTSFKYRVRTDNYIVWDKADNSNKNRLLYQIYDTRSDLDESGEETCNYKPTLTLSKPLIETKGHIRLKVQEELQLFYQSIIKYLGVGNLSEIIIVDSPNLFVPF